MKTTANLSDELVHDAQEQRTGEQEFALKDASVDGRGLRPAFRGAAGKQVWDMIYQQPIGGQG
ncbi:MAG TPA: hypothetical protein VG317_16695 [Pseudonocardiaceae bacterium]|nr:hypothetical protein [Pseudonocardiaceae bacterium]